MPDLELKRALKREAIGEMGGASNVWLTGALVRSTPLRCTLATFDDRIWLEKIELASLVVVLSRYHAHVLSFYCFPRMLNDESHKSELIRSKDRS